MDARHPAKNHDLVHHREGERYIYVCCTEQLEKAAIELSVGSVGDSDDNTHVEIINAL